MLKIVNFLQKKFPDIFSENEYATLLKEVEEEKQELSALTTERDMVMLPEVVGNLITNHMTMVKINSEFYKDHPEFKDKKDVVAAVVEMTEGQHPLESYDELLKLALPEIRERINTMKTIDMENVNPNPERNFAEVLTVEPNNQHGEL